MKTATITPKPNPNDIMINCIGSDPPPGLGMVGSWLAICAIINAVHKKIKVPKNSPKMAMEWFLHTELSAALALGS